jgi:hypothetical protein
MQGNGQSPEPPDIRTFLDRRHQVPWEELAKYVGQHVAWTPDGSRILAAGADVHEVDDKLAALGIHFSQVVHDYIDPDPMAANHPLLSFF